jgi:hypothetical protein
MTTVPVCLCAAHTQDKDPVSSFCSSTLGQQLNTQELAIAGVYGCVWVAERLPAQTGSGSSVAAAVTTAAQQRRHQLALLQKPAAAEVSACCPHAVPCCAADVAGRNWGDVSIDGSSLLYTVDNKALFEVPLPDVSQAQQTKVRVYRQIECVFGGRSVGVT